MKASQKDSKLKTERYFGAPTKEVDSKGTTARAKIANSIAITPPSLSGIVRKIA